MPVRCHRRWPTASPCRCWASCPSPCSSASSIRSSRWTRRIIALAILRLIELEKSVVEGGGAAPLAAFLSGKLDNLKGKQVVLTLCGGNIDLTMLGRVIEVGLVADGRLSRFTVSISDRPGGLARLAELIASTGASIKEIVHDRAFSGPDLTAVRVICVVETTGHAHVQRTARRAGRLPGCGVARC